MSKPPLTGKRQPANERLLDIRDLIGEPARLRIAENRLANLRRKPSWQKPTVTEVCHLNFHGLLDLLLAHPLTPSEEESVAAIISDYEMHDDVSVIEVPPVSEEEMALFPFTDISEREHCYCNELLKVRDLRVHWVRWLAVRDAHALTNADLKVSWVHARQAASHRLEGTPAAGSTSTMKHSYDRVARILRTPVTFGN